MQIPFGPEEGPISHPEGLRTKLARSAMAELQRISLWKAVAAPKTTAMVGRIGVSAMVSCPPVGLDINVAGAKHLIRCMEKQIWDGRRDDSRGRSAWGTVAMARRDRGGSARSPVLSTSRSPRKQHESPRSSSPISTKKMQKESKQERDHWEDDEDALEALFTQLEMDLEAGGISDDEDLTEEEAVELENELAEALGDMDESEEEELRAIDVAAVNVETDPEADGLTRVSKSSRRNRRKYRGQNTRIRVKDEFSDAILEEYEDEEHEQRVVTLEPWQLKKLAAAVQIGRRKVYIKALSSEVGIDRFDVLAWLKNPPPELLMYGATMNDEEIADELPLEDGASSSSPENSIPAGKQRLGADPEGGQNWHSQKRLKKQHQATFERVFRNTDRPSNSIVQNLVELTHVPRKRIVEWFEERRTAIRDSPKFEALK